MKGVPAFVFWRRHWFPPFLVALALGIAACAENGAVESSPTISAAELVERLEAGTAPLILDVRTPGEYSGAHIPGAINVPHDALANRLDELPVSPAVATTGLPSRYLPSGGSLLGLAPQDRPRRPVVACFEDLTRW